MKREVQLEQDPRPAVPLLPSPPSGKKAGQPIVREMRLTDDDGYDIVIRYYGEEEKLYKFLMAYSKFKFDRKTKPT